MQALFESMKTGFALVGWLTLISFMAQNDPFYKFIIGGLLVFSLLGPVRVLIDRYDERHK
jgi:hypothetical protein